jgi:hypothetical protein
MTVRTNILARNDAIDAFVAALGAAATAKFYTGGQPGDAETAASGTLLATMSLPNPPYSAASAASAAKNGTWQVTVTVGGTAGWCRIANAADTMRQDYSVGTGAEDIVFDVVIWEVDGVVTITTATVSQAEG